MNLLYKLKKMIERKENGMKFGIIADEWLGYKKNTVKESTYYEYMKIVEKYLKPKFKNEKIEKIVNINEYIQELNKEYGVNTIRGIISVFKSIISYCEDEYDFRIKIKKISLPKSYQPRVEVFTKRETVKLERFCLQQINLNNLGIIIALNTGLRIGEICGLQWKDIDLNQKQIYVNKTVERIHDTKTGKSKVIVTKPKTENSIRKIPICSKLYNVLKLLKPRYKENYYLISGNEKVVEPRTYQNTYSKILKKNKIRHRKFHCLRHTFATNCIEVGMDVKSLSEILGHSNVNITLSTYVHSSEKQKKKYLEKL